MDTDGRCSRHEIGSPYSILMVVICAVRIWLLVFLATRLVIRSSSLLLSSSLRNSWGSRRIVSHTLHKGIEQQHLATTPTEQWMAHKNVSEVFACFGPLAFLSRPSVAIQYPLTISTTALGYSFALNGDIIRSYSLLILSMIYCNLNQLPEWATAGSAEGSILRVKGAMDGKVLNILARRPEIGWQWRRAFVGPNLRHRVKKLVNFLCRGDVA